MLGVRFGAAAFEIVRVGPTPVKSNLIRVVVFFCLDNSVKIKFCRSNIHC